ncbi:flagellar biosynthetic protein FliR [Pseudotabrizicola sp. L79]|uniref:flagellar biosynthetic protein FliR n=1 Tax=Pseudotabrizicola sp. L79 TaxID=3118402 RepID=UPI002F952EBD
MTELLNLLMRDFGVASPVVVAAALAFLRVGAAMAVLPGLGEQSIPARIRLATAILLSVALTPAIMAQVQDIPFAQALLPEMVIGLTLGIALRFFVFALATAGAIIANSTSLSQLFAQGAEPQPAISQFLVMAGISLALATGLLPKLVGYLLLSYDAFPAGQFPQAERLAGWAMHHADVAFALGFQIALPFAVASLLYNLALGIINRAMPQLMVTFIGAPALSLGGLALMALATPLLLSVWLQAFNSFLLPTPAG